MFRILGLGSGLDSILQASRFLPWVLVEISG